MKRQARFLSDVEYIKEDKLNAKDDNEDIKSWLEYKHQSILSLPPNQEKLFEQISEKLKKKKSCISSSTFTCNIRMAGR